MAPQLPGTSVPRRSELPERHQTLLWSCETTGDGHHEDGPPACIRDFAAIAAQVAELEWSETDFAALFDDTPMRVRLIGEWGEHRYDRELRKRYQRAVNRRAAENAHVRARLDAVPPPLWPKGKRGGTTRAIYAALATVEYRAGSSDFSASVRQLCELALISTHGTVVAALKELQRARLLERRSSAPDGTQCWSLPQPECCDETRSVHSATQYPCTRDVYARDNGGRSEHTQEALPVLHAVWSYAGLGPNAQRVHAYLTEHGPTTAAQLARALGLSRSGLTRKPYKGQSKGLLHRMAEVGMAAQKPESREWVALDVSLDHVAEELDGPGARVLDRQKLLHKWNLQERERWRLFQYAQAQRNVARTLQAVHDDTHPDDDVDWWGPFGSPRRPSRVVPNKKGRARELLAVVGFEGNATQCQRGEARSPLVHARSRASAGGSFPENFRDRSMSESDPSESRVHRASASTRPSSGTAPVTS